MDMSTLLDGRQRRACSFWAISEKTSLPLLLKLEEPGQVPAQFLLTPRELEVIRLLVRGKSSKELAADLDMSVRTAETHHANILGELNVKSLGDLVRIAFRDGVS
jgi:DNA-binding CsgD family transcriptional regulator